MNPTTTPQPTSFENYKAALTQFNDPNTRGRQAIGASQAASVLPAYDYAQNQAASQEASRLRIQQLKDAVEGKNYQVIKKEDGGFDFYDPLGQKINLHQYSMATGIDPISVLKNSDNSLDRQFTNDYNNVHRLEDALYNNDRATLQKMAIQLYGDNSKPADDPTNKKVVQQFSDVIGNGKDLLKKFTQYYPNVYGDLPWNKFPQGTAQPHSPGLPGYQLPVAPPSNFQKLLGVLHGG